MKRALSKAFCFMFSIIFLLQAFSICTLSASAFAENARSVQEIALTAMQSIDEYTDTQAEIITYYANFTYQG